MRSTLRIASWFSASDISGIRFANLPPATTRSDIARTLAGVSSVRGRFRTTATGRRGRFIARLSSAGNSTSTAAPPRGVRDEIADITGSGTPHDGPRGAPRGRSTLKPRRRYPSTSTRFVGRSPRRSPRQESTCSMRCTWRRTPIRAFMPATSCGPRRCEPSPTQPLPRPPQGPRTEPILCDDSTPSRASGAPGNVTACDDSSSDWTTYRSVVRATD